MSVGAVNKSTGDRIPTAGMPVIDAALSGSSTNPVQNRVVKAAFDAIKDGQSIDSFADVETALGEKADTDIVASDFSTAASYTAGDYCIYEGKFYKFKANHSGAWSAADVDEIKIAGELSSLMSGLTNVAQTVNHTTSYSAQDLQITGVNAFKNANTVCVDVIVNLSNYTAGDWYVLGTLPSALRPLSEMRFCAYNNSTASKDSAYTYPVKISANGELSVYIWNDVTTNVSINQAFTYIAVDAV